MVGERDIAAPAAERRRLRAELATGRAGVSRNLAEAEGRLQGSWRRVVRWRWSVPLLLAAGGGVLLARVGRPRRPDAGRGHRRAWALSLLRTTLAPILLRAAVRYVEARLTGPGRREPTGPKQ